MMQHPAHDAYTYFGAHPTGEGYTFRVWAPNARAVALAGDFNGWAPCPMTRLDGGVVQAAYPVAVGPVLQRVERMLGMVAEEKGVTISGSASEDAVALATDDDVHQILYNLMENAIKYSAAENGFVRAEALVRDGQVVITVTDNGIGIPDEDLPHVFDRFYRVDKMRSREVGGTGLGLSIVKDTIENRGGSIQAGHGADGVGTVFTVTLPLAQEEELCEE